MQDVQTKLFKLLMVCFFGGWKNNLVRLKSDVTHSYKTLSLSQASFKDQMYMNKT